MKRESIRVFFLSEKTTKHPKPRRQRKSQAHSNKVCDVLVITGPSHPSQGGIRITGNACFVSSSPFRRATKCALPPVSRVWSLLLFSREKIKKREIRKRTRARNENRLSFGMSSTQSSPTRGEGSAYPYLLVLQRTSSPSRRVSRARLQKASLGKEVR